MNRYCRFRNFSQIRRQLRCRRNNTKAKVLQSFFKTEPGQYAAGDVFLGIPVGELRRISRACDDIRDEDIIRLLHSKIHEERFLALLVLMRRYRQADARLKKRFFRLYLNNIRWVNNWDLVDLSAPAVIGSHLFHTNKRLLYRLAASQSLWQRRIAIVATLHFIRNDDFTDTLKLARCLLTDKHDLIHKATGWMLREVGKRNRRVLEQFLDKYHISMPRTMLRYAIERLPGRQRQAYLRGKTLFMQVD